MDPVVSAADVGVGFSAYGYRAWKLWKKKQRYQPVASQLGWPLSYTKDVIRAYEMYRTRVGEAVAELEAAAEASELEEGQSPPPPTASDQPDVAPMPVKVQVPDPIDPSETAYLLRVSGYSEREIAAHLKQDVADVKRWITERTASSMEDRVRLRQVHMDLDLSRLDLLLRSQWQEALAGDSDSIRVVMSLMERRAKMVGYDAPARTESAQYRVSASSADLDVSKLTTEELRLYRQLQEKAATRKVDHSLPPGPQREGTLSKKASGESEEIPVSVQVTSVQNVEQKPEPALERTEEDSEAFFEGEVARTLGGAEN